MNIEFSIASSDDITNIIDLCNLCFDEDTSYDYALKVFKETKESGNDIYIVGKIDQKVVAHAKITIIKTIYEKMNTYAILNHVCVHPDYRRNNIATKMLDEITKICKEKHCVAMELWSMNFRTAAHACYKNYGFTKDDAGFFSKSLKEEANEFNKCDAVFFSKKVIDEESSNGN